MHGKVTRQEEASVAKWISTAFACFEAKSHHADMPRFQPLSETNVTRGREKRVFGSGGMLLMVLGLYMKRGGRERKLGLGVSPFHTVQDTKKPTSGAASPRDFRARGVSVVAKPQPRIESR